MIYGGAPATVKIPFCIDSSSGNDIDGRDFIIESNLPGDDESSDDNFEMNQHNNFENTGDFLNVNNEPSLKKGVDKTGNSGVNKKKIKSDNIMSEFI